MNNTLALTFNNQVSYLCNKASGVVSSAVLAKCLGRPVEEHIMRLDELIDKLEQLYSVYLTEEARTLPAPLATLVVVRTALLKRSS